MEMSDSESPADIPAQSLGEENARLKADLEECKIRLFELLYEDNQVSDGSIRKEYDDICESIEKWIDEVFKECDFTRRFNVVLKREPHKLAKLGIDPEIQDSELEDDGAPGMAWLSRQETCNHIVLSLAIWDILENYIFCKQFPVGTTKDQTVLFEDILNVKNKGQDEGACLTRLPFEPHIDSEPAGTLIRARKWRSETVTAMTKTLGFKDSLEQMSKSIFRELVKDMRYWVEIAFHDHEDELREDIFIPAIQLHCSMTCSTRDYVLKPANVIRNQAPTKASSWTLRDILTWRKVGYNANDGSQRALYGMTPGLYRCGVNKEADLELVKPVVVVYKGQQRIEPSSSLKAPSPSPTRDRARNTDNLNHAKDRPHKRQSYSERSNDSSSFSIAIKDIFLPKKKHSESKQKQSESLVKESRPKSTTGHRSRTNTGRRSSQDHSGGQSTSHNSNQQRRADTMPVSLEDNEEFEPVARLIRSSTSSDIAFDHGQTPREHEMVRSNDSMSGVSTVHQGESVSRLPPGTHVSTTRLEISPDFCTEDRTPQ